MQILYLLREMRPNGEEEGRLVLFLLASHPLQEQSLEVEFCFHLEIGNTFKSPHVFTFIFDPQSYKRLQFFQFSTYIFSADITPEILKLGRVTKVKVFLLVLVYVFLILIYLNFRPSIWRRVC